MRGTLGEVCDLLRQRVKINIGNMTIVPLSNGLFCIKAGHQIVFDEINFSQTFFLISLTGGVMEIYFEV